jgi:hypothetical protein
MLKELQNPLAGVIITWTCAPAFMKIKDAVL